jgi:glycosyltransferase involved in cell wall biosynthesis
MLQDFDSPQVSIVIPVYGSANILPELNRRITSVMLVESWSYEIIFVCDESPDQSWSVISALAEEFPSVRGILLRMNAGQHNALLAGLEDARGDVIVTLDDDLQHSPSDIPSLVRKIKEDGFEVAYAQFPERKHPLWKVVGSFVNNLIANTLIKKPTKLYLSPFRAFSSAIRDEIVAYKGPFIYLDGIILTTTRRIVAVPAVHFERHSGQSNYGIGKSISLLLKLATNFSILPLRITSIVGLVTAGLGSFAAVVFIIQKLAWDVMPTGWASLMVTILLLGGINLIGIGVLGEYLGRVLLILNGKRPFLVESRVGMQPLERENK